MWRPKLPNSGLCWIRETRGIHLLCVPRLAIYLWTTVGSSLVFVCSLRSGEGHAGLFVLQEEVLVYKSCLSCLLRKGRFNKDGEKKSHVEGGQIREECFPGGDGFTTEQRERDPESRRRVMEKPEKGEGCFPGRDGAFFFYYHGSTLGCSLQLAQSLLLYLCLLSHLVDVVLYFAVVMVASVQIMSFVFSSPLSNNHVNACNDGSDAVGKEEKGKGQRLVGLMCLSSITSTAHRATPIHPVAMLQH
ncbi:hypothetical protein MUK42_34238 [Musa troglodytarum]|uniref:Uncharacterized protein n=1 Tax=Musa troglodytarum TaxID=320322 RepID=A0A9E7GXW0_9LILI|nr:hypothetical protein MUK42_34238 [Musa troglodytarum]